MTMVDGLDGERWNLEEVSVEKLESMLADYHQYYPRAGEGGYRDAEAVEAIEEIEEELAFRKEEL